MWLVLDLETAQLSVYLIPTEGSWLWDDTCANSLACCTENEQLTMEKNSWNFLWVSSKAIGILLVLQVLQGCHGTTIGIFLGTELDCWGLIPMFVDLVMENGDGKLLNVWDTIRVTVDIDDVCCFHAWRSLLHLSSTTGSQSQHSIGWLLQSVPYKGVNIERYTL